MLGELTELVHLDISDDKDDHPPFDILAPGAKFKISTLLQKVNSLPKLHSFDISGWYSFSKLVFNGFLF